MIWYLLQVLDLGQGRASHKVIAVNVVAQEVVANNEVAQEVVANKLAAYEAVLNDMDVTRH